MKRVINGKAYDTNMATIVNHICVRVGTPHIVWLYRKQGGEYYRVSHYYKTDPPRYEIESVSANDAKEV